MSTIQDDDDLAEISQDLLSYVTARRQGGRGRGQSQQHLQTPGRAPSIADSRHLPSRSTSSPSLAQNLHSSPSQRPITVYRSTSSHLLAPAVRSTSPSQMPRQLPGYSQATDSPSTSSHSLAPGVLSTSPSERPLSGFNKDMQGSFAFLRCNTVRPKKRTSEQSKISPAKKYIKLQFFLSPRPTERTPKPSEEIRLLEAGLGKRTVTLAEDADHEEIVSVLEGRYSKLQTLEGAWMLHKSSGGVGQKKLTQINAETEGYTGSFLKTVSGNCKHMLYIVPIQDELDESPLPHDSPEFVGMPSARCRKCGVSFPVQFLVLHVQSCDVEQTSDEEYRNVPQVIGEDVEDHLPVEDSAAVAEMFQCPFCGLSFPRDDIDWHGNICADGISDSSLTSAEGPSHMAAVGPVLPGPSQASLGPAVPEWNQIEVASRAAALFRTRMIREQRREPPLHITMDLHSDVKDREASVIGFYKMKRNKWAADLSCDLGGDRAVGHGVTRFFLSFAMQILQTGLHMNFGTSDITRLFEGEKGHLIPSTSQPLLDSDLFFMAGRMVGHSFIHGGPGLAGLSPAIVHVLLGGPIETATVELEDCPDLDQRETIKLLEGQEELSEDQKSDVRHLTDMFDLPPLTVENRKYIHQTLLQQVVLGRTSSQIKQLRKGLKETGVWPILGRKDVAEIVFPREVPISPQLLIDKIIWPSTVEDEDEDYPPETRRRIGTYLRQFIETAPAEILVELVKFWTAWEVLDEKRLVVEIGSGQFPTSKTCYRSLRIPGCFQTYEDFERALVASIGTNNTGFGMH